jgi:hypothetical protein
VSKIVIVIYTLRLKTLPLESSSLFSLPKSSLKISLNKFFIYVATAYLFYFMQTKANQNLKHLIEVYNPHYCCRKDTQHRLLNRVQGFKSTTRRGFEGSSNHVGQGFSPALKASLKACPTGVTRPLTP